MNYSTTKRNILATLIFLLVSIGSTLQAQETTPKIFGGIKQYRTWSLGFNAGALAPKVLTIVHNDYQNAEFNLGYGLTIRKQLSHNFGLELGFMRGKLSANNTNLLGLNTNKSFETTLNWSTSFMGVANLCTVDFLKKENSLNLLVKAGYGFTGTKTTVNTNLNTLTNSSINHQSFIPVGVGAKFKVSKRINFDLGYNTYFFDGDNLDGTTSGSTVNDKFAYVYTGLEFSLGNVAKPNLDWVNPIALMYEELKNPELRKELDALKQRVSTLEAADLLKDSDGDGVADKLDKCPNTEAGIKVDGGGCPLDTDNDGVPDSKDNCPTEKGIAEFNGCPNSPSTSANVIQFEFNSSVLKTSSYPILDQLSSDLRSKEILKVELGGHASMEGTPDYNLQLSKDRANAVKTYLVNSGVAASKIITNGFGETRPVASNNTEEGRQLNRRVEVVR
jgi:OOP family OmpA-OmpF porin